MSSTSLPKAGRTKADESTGGVFVAVNEYPGNLLVGVVESPGSSPFALSIVIRSLPGTAGVGGPAMGVCCA